MDNVSCIEFPGNNITIDGVNSVNKKPELPPRLQLSKE
jgi:hypothetical protein